MRTVVHVKLHVHKTVTVGANLKFNLQFTNWYSFPYIFCYHLTLKNISLGHAQQKQFSRFN